MTAKYLITKTKAKSMGMYVAHINRNGISYCGKATKDKATLSDTIDSQTIKCKLCKPN